LLVPELPDLDELDGCGPTTRAVGSLVFGFVSPILKKHLRLEETVELVAVQELVAKTDLESRN